MKQSKHQPLDQNSIQALLDIFKITQTTGDGVDSVCYRAQHEELLTQLDTLKKTGYLREEDEEYWISLSGLPLLGDAHLRELFEHFEKIFSVLRNHYKSKPRTTVLINDLASLAGLSFKETLVCIEYMSEISWWSSRTKGTNQVPENPLVPSIKPSERILKYKSFQDVIEEAKRWHRKREIENHVIEKKNSPGDDVNSLTLMRYKEEHIVDTWQKALDRRSFDPEGAITAARTLLESVCKHILDEKAVTYDDKTDLPKLYSMVANELDLGPNQHTEKVFKQILGSCQSVVEGLGSLRNKLSDAHGKGKAGIKPALHHAEMAVNLAGTMATFLIATWEARKKP